MAMMRFGLAYPEIAAAETRLALVENPWPEDFSTRPR